MAKRGHGEGSISRRKDGRWMGQVTIGTDPVTGKSKRKTFYGKTRKEVADKVREALNQKEKGLLATHPQVTVKDWLITWLNDYKKHELKISTWTSYKGLINDHIIPGLGAIKLNKLRTNDIQKFYNAKLKNGRKDGKKGGLSPRTVKYIHIVLSQALDQAVKEGYIYINPATATTQPRQVKKQITPLTTDQVKQFLQDIKEEWLYPVYITAIGTGLRRGELLGLKWDVIDLEEGTAQIKRQLILVNNKPLLEEYTKTKGSTRTIALPDMVVRELKKLKKQQDELKNPGGKVVALKREEENDAYVFCWPNGSYNLTMLTRN